MIYKNNKEITGIQVGNRIIIAVYKGSQLVWEKLKHLSAWFRSEGYFRSEPW